MTGLFIVTTLLLSSLLTSGSVVTNNDFNGRSDVQQEVEIDAEQPSTFTVSVPVLREIQGSSMESYLDGSQHLQAWVVVDGSIRSDEVIRVTVDEDITLNADGGLKNPVAWKAHIIPDSTSYYDWSGVKLTERDKVPAKCIRVKVEDNLSAGLWRGYIHVNVTLEEYGSLLNEQQLLTYVCSDVATETIIIPKYIIVDNEKILIRGLDKSSLNKYTKLSEIVLQTDGAFYLEGCFDGCSFENKSIKVVGNNNLVKVRVFGQVNVDVSYDNCELYMYSSPYRGSWDSEQGCMVYENKDTFDVSKATDLEGFYGDFTEVTLNERLLYISSVPQWCTFDKLNIPDFVFDCTESFTFQRTRVKEVNISNEFVGEGWFNNCSVLTKVVLNDGVKYIGAQAFAECSNLTDVTIPDSVVKIDSSSFAGTPFLDNLKKGVEEVYINGIWVAHGELYNGGVSYTMPASETVLSDSIVTDSVTSLSFVSSDRLAKISRRFSNIKSIDITGRPLAYGWWYYFPDLTSITVGGKNASAGTWQFSKKITDITLVEGLQTIEDFAFNHVTEYAGNSLYVPKTVSKIGGIKEWSSHVFYDFGKDSTYAEDGTLTTKGFSEFDVDEDSEYYTDIDGILYTKDLSQLIAIPRAMEFDNGVYMIPDEVVTLGELTFSRNFNIQEVVLGDSYKILSSKQEVKDKYGNYASVLNEGNSLSIAIYQFSDVQKYTVKETNPYYKSIDGVVYTKDGKELVAVPNHYVGDIVIPEGCEKIRENAFWIDYELSTVHAGVTSISLPSTMKYIEPRQLQYLNNKFGTGKVTLAAGCDSYVRYTEWIRSRGILPVGTIGSPLPYTGQTGTYWNSTGGTNKYNVGVDSNTAYATFEPIFIPEGTHKFSFDSDVPINYVVIFSQSDGKVTSTKISETKIPWTYTQSTFTVPSGGRIAWIAATYYNTETKKPINSQMTKDIGDEILSKLVIEKCTD